MGAQGHGSGGVNHSVLEKIATAWCAVSLVALGAVFIDRHAVLGPNYSARLFTTVAVAFIGTLAFGIYLVARRRMRRGSIALLVSFVWAYLWAVNSAV
jgi:hypothetical protein